VDLQKYRKTFNIIWLVGAWIIWKEKNKRIFQQKEENILSLDEYVKLHVFWWFKSTYAIFDFDYNYWNLSPLVCPMIVT